MPRYFAYGSNMSRSRLEDRIGAVHDLGKVVLPGWRHRFSKLGLDGTGKGNVEWAGRVGIQGVWGVLYELDDHQLERLCGIEVGYQLRSFELRASGSSEVGAASFVAHRIIRGLSPTPTYLEHYRAGIEEHAIPRGYLDRLLGREHII